MKTILCIASVVLTTTTFAQNVSNKIKFPNGKKLEMTSQVSSVISQEAMGQSMETKLNATITRQFNVQNATAENTTIEHQVSRVQMSMASPMGGDQNFDSNNPKDMQSDAGKDIAGTLKKKYTINVDGTGKITSVKNDDKAGTTDSTAQNDVMANVLSQLVGGLNVPKAGERSEFKILPDQEIRKGTSWTDSLQTGLATYTVSDINDTAVVVTYKGNGTLEKKQEMMGQEVTISSKDSTTGTILIDRKTGILKSNVSTTTSEGSMEVMGQTIPMNTKTTRTVTVRPKV